MKASQRCKFHISSALPCHLTQHQVYYDFIHTYFPLLSPRTSPPCWDRPLQCPISCSNPSAEPLLMHQPRSPLSLAIAAVLALIPHPDDPDSTSPTSVLQRKTYAHKFARLANSASRRNANLSYPPPIAARPCQAGGLRLAGTDFILGYQRIWRLFLLY